MSHDVTGTHLPCSIMQPCIMQVPPNTRVKCALGFAPMRDEAMQLIQLSKENASTWSLFYIICMEDLRHEVEIAWNGIRRVDSLCSVEKGSDSRQRIEAEFHFPGICKPRVHRWQKNVASFFLHIIFRFRHMTHHEQHQKPPWRKVEDETKLGRPAEAKPTSTEARRRACGRVKANHSIAKVPRRTLPTTSKRGSFNFELITACFRGGSAEEISAHPPSAEAKAVV